MEAAQRRDAVRKEQFWFRQDVVLEGFGLNGVHREETAHERAHQGPKIVKMECNEVFNGSDRFPGLIPLIKKYLKSMEVDVDTQCTIIHYLNLISKRAKGEFLTTATWIRNFVTSHPDYKKDSKVSRPPVLVLVHVHVHIRVRT